MLVTTFLQPWYLLNLYRLVSLCNQFVSGNCRWVSLSSWDADWQINASCWGRITRTTVRAQVHSSPQCCSIILPSDIAEGVALFSIQLKWKQYLCGSAPLFSHKYFVFPPPQGLALARQALSHWAKSPTPSYKYLCAYIDTQPTHSLPRTHTIPTTQSQSQVVHMPYMQIHWHTSDCLLSGLQVSPHPGHAPDVLRRRRAF